jgi:ribonuclease G
MSIDTIIFEKINQVSGIALLGKGELKEIEIINDSMAVSGNIYLGKVSRKISLANDKEGFFINIGLEQDGFLNAEECGMQGTKITEGQTIVVQINQEKRAEKNAKLVRAVQLVGSYLVYCPYRLNVEASSKIEDKYLMTDYIEKVKENMTGQEGWILRTAAVDVSFEEIAKEMRELRDTYEAVRVKARTEHAPCLLYSKPDSIFEYISKYVMSLKRIIMNNHNIEKEIKDKYEDKFDILYKQNPFAEYSIDEAIGEALEKTVNLKNGGRITIEETRACVAIDVDSGRDSGGGSITRINEEAAGEIVKQIRLRNLAGKIIVDFAGNNDFKYMKPIIAILEEQLAKDSVKSYVAGLSRTGLVEIMRVRRRPSLYDIMAEECPTCRGSGRVEK